MEEIAGLNRGMFQESEVTSWLFQNHRNYQNPDLKADLKMVREEVPKNLRGKSLYTQAPVEQTVALAAPEINYLAPYSEALPGEPRPVTRPSDWEVVVAR